MKTIYHNQHSIFSLQDIQHFVPLRHIGKPNGAFLITKHTTYNREVDDYENAIYVCEEDLPGVLDAWSKFKELLLTPTD